MYDNSDRIVELLETIALQQGAEPTDINIDRSKDITNISGGSAGRLLRNYRIRETADMDESNSSGEMEFSAGEQSPIVTYEVSPGNTVRLLSVGASDVQDMRYAVLVDDDTFVGGWTETPLGTVQEPFSLVDKAGGYIEAENRIKILGHYTADTGTASVVGSLHYEIV